jgi:hypothetical protein
MKLSTDESQVTVDNEGNQISSEALKSQETKGLDNPDTDKALEIEKATQQAETTDPPVTDDGTPDEHKRDWVETRLLSPHISVENLFEVYGTEGFNKFKSREDYWKNTDIKGMFVDQYGYDAKFQFDQLYDNYKTEFAQFELGNFMRSKSGYELVRDDLSDLRATAKLRYTNSVGAKMMGDDWGAETKDFRENFVKIRQKVIGDNGEESYEVIEYSAEALKKLELDPLFDGLAYSDTAVATDPYAPTEGFIYEAVYEGKILSPSGKGLVDVRNDQVVSQWDLETGSFLDGILKNNKLEAEGILDYAKILVKAPSNMVINLLDTGVQLTRAVSAGIYGGINGLTGKDLDIDDSKFYRNLTSIGVRAKKYTTSMSGEAMRDGYFGSLETALSTTADIVLQVALASALGKLSAKAAKIAVGDVTGAAGMATLARAQGRAAKIAVRGTLTAMATKDSYNEAIENGFTKTEAAIFTGAIGVAMWLATSQANYIIGEYGSKHVREAVRKSLKRDVKEVFRPAIRRAMDNARIQTGKEADEYFAKASVDFAKKQIKKVFSGSKNLASGTRKLLNSSQWIYEAKQEAIEEMSEELGQDLVKHAASAYGVLLKDAQGIGKGRFMSFLDEGYFENMAERYATSAVAGGMGGLVGMRISPNRIKLSPITDTSSITEIIQAGHGKQLVEALDKLKKEGSLGPEKLAAEYNYDLGIFEPMVENSGEDSLGDMVYKTYLNDINIIDTFLDHGMFGQARKNMKAEFSLRESVNNTNMRKDFAEVMASIIDFHSRTGITTKVYEDMDNLNEAQLTGYIPEALSVIQTTLEKRRQDLKNYQEKVAKDKLKVLGAVQDDTEEPKTETVEKEDEEMAKGSDIMLDHLRERVQEVEGLGKEDLKTMLVNYKKIRAIASGASAEYYLLQNQVSDDPILGNMKNRDAKYKDLGETPIKDMMYDMRFRLLEDKQNELYNEERANEIEGTITAMDGLDAAQLATIKEIVRNSGDKLTKNSVAHIRGIYDKMTIPAESFNVDSPKSIFKKDASGNVSKESVVDAYMQILTLSPSNSMPFGLKEYLMEGTEAEEFFKEASVDSKDLKIPVYMQAEPFYAIDGEEYLIETLNNARTDKELSVKHGNIIAPFLNSLPAAKLEFRTIANGPRFREGTHYDPKKGSTHPLQTMLRSGSVKGLGVDTLLKKGLDQVVALLDSGMGPANDIYTKSDYSHLEKVSAEIQIKEALASQISLFTNPAEVLGTARTRNINMLANFRLNVLDIINFKYKIGTVHNTRIEDHPYKEYTSFSDFFVDFVYDPLKIKTALSKEPGNRNQEDKDALERLKKSNEVTLDSTVDGPLDAQIPIEDLHLAFLLKFKGLVTPTDKRDAVKFLKDPKSELIVNTKDGKVTVKVDNMTALRVAESLFADAITIMKDIENGDSPLPYIKEKDAEVRDAFDVYTDFLSGTGDANEYIGEIVRKMVPDFDEALIKLPENMTTVELGRINIQVENAIYKIYNKDPEVNFISSPNYDHINLNLDIDTYIKNKVSIGTQKQSLSQNVIARKAGIMLMGAITTDFTSFYAKFKGILTNSVDSDKVVIAAQEQTAKYVSAYIFSEKFKEYSHNLYSGGENVTYVKGIFGSGVAGSGKSSATIQLGTNIGISISKDLGFTNVAVQAIGNNDGQVAIIEEAVGELALGNKGMTPSELVALLSKAVNEKDTVAIEKVKGLGAIIIDEVTYLQAYNVAKEDKEIPILKKIASLIETFNDRHNLDADRKTISLVMLGDPAQSGNVIVNETLVVDASIEDKHLFSLNYMSFSFRNRNSFLTSSLDAINTSKPVISLEDMSAGDGVTLKPGTKYGLSGITKYGVNISNANDQNSNEDFMAVMSDDNVISNIKENIDASIEANKDKKPGDPGYKKPFSVLIVPSSKNDFMGAESAMMKQLIKDDKYKPFIRVVDYSEVGGSEANYVFAEIPKHPFKGIDVEKTTSYSLEMHKALTTLATRAFDYAHIINRSDGIDISSSARSISMADDEVIIPNTELDDASKIQVKKHYIDIMDGITADGKIIPNRPSVVITDVDEFVMPTDMQRAMSEITAKLLLEPTSIMSVEGITKVIDDIDSTKLADFASLVSYIQDIGNSTAETILPNVIKATEALALLKEDIDPKAYEEFEFLISSARILYTSEDYSFVNKLFAAQLDSVSAIVNLGADEYFNAYPGTNISVESLVKSLATEMTTNGDQHLRLFNMALQPSLRKNPDNQKIYREAINNEVKKFIPVLSPDSKLVRRDPTKVTDEVHDKLFEVMAGIVENAAYVFELEGLTTNELTDTRRLSEFDTWLDTKTPEEILDVMLEIDRLITRETLVGEKIKLRGVKDLLTEFSTDSVFNMLKDAAYTRYNIKRAEQRRNDGEPEVIEDHYEQFDKLKAEAGIDDGTIDKLSIRVAIENLAEKARVSGIKKDMLMAEKLKALFDTIYATEPTDKFDKSDTWYNRGVGRAETLNDYVIRRVKESHGNHLYSIPTDSYGHNALNLEKSFDEKKYVAYKDYKDVLNLFGYGIGSTPYKGNMPTRLGLRAIKDPERINKKGEKVGGNLNIFVVGIKGDTHYIISQIIVDNTNGDGTGSKVMEDYKDKGDYPAEMIESIKNIIEQGTDSRLNKDPHNGHIYLDVEIEGKPTDKILFRAGSQEIVKGGQGSTLAALQGKGINTNSHAYVFMRKDSTMESEDNTLLGETYVMYSAHNGLNLKSTSIKQDNLDGSIVSTGKVIVDSSTGIPVEVGMLPVHIEANFSRIADALSKVNTPLIGELPTMLSMIMQRHISETIGTFKVGQKLDIDSGVIETLTITEALIKHGSMMGSGYNLASTVNKRADFIKKINADYATIQGNPELLAILDELTTVYMKDFIDHGVPTKNLLYKPKDGEAYILAINRFLKQNDKQFLDKLTKLANITGYSIKPNITSGFDAKTVNVGLINDIFVKELSDLIKIVPTDIKLPSVQLNSSGKVSIMDALENPPAGDGSGGGSVFSYSDEQLDLKDTITAFKRDVVSIENVEDINLAKDYVESGHALITELAKHPGNQEDIKNLTSSIKDIEDWIAGANVNLFGATGILLNSDDFSGTTIYEKAFSEGLSIDANERKRQLKEPRALFLNAILMRLYPKGSDTMQEIFSVLYEIDPKHSFNDILSIMGDEVSDDADMETIETLLSNNCKF